MKFDKLKEYYQKGITLKGRNLEDQQNVSFNLITQGKFSGIDGQFFYFDPKNSPEEYEQAKKLEELMDKLYEAAEATKVAPMPVRDGKVVLLPGTPFHRAIQEKQVIKNIAAGGILASEWFGQLESAREGSFCAFLNTVITPEEVSRQCNSYRRQNIIAQKADKKECVFYFDPTNPIMQTLLRMDYFEYEHIKRTAPEKLEEIYPKQVRDLLDYLIEPNSPYGKKMHDNPNDPSYDWLAIPGGIPPQLINGICIHSSRADILEDIEQIKKAFPNATIFDENNNVLARSTDNQHQP